MSKVRLPLDAIAAFAASTFLISADRQVVAPVLPAMAHDFRATIGATAEVVSAYLLFYGLFEMAYGNLADRYGRVRVAGLAMQVFGLGTLFTGLMPTLGSVIALRALTGAAAAALVPIGLTYIGDTVALERRQQAIGRINTASALGQAFSVALGGLIGQLFSWRLLFVVYGVAASAAAVVLRRAPESTAAGGVAEPVWRTLGRVLRVPGLVPLYVLAFLEGGAFYGSYVYLSPELHGRGFNYLVVGVVLAAMGATTLLGTQAIQRALVRHDPVPFIWAGGLALSVGYVIVARSGGIGGVLACAACVGLGIAWCHSGLQTWATQAFPEARGLTVSGFAFSLFVGGGVFTQAMAPLADRGAYSTMFLIAAAAGLLVAVGGATGFRRYHVERRVAGDQAAR